MPGGYQAKTISVCKSADYDVMYDRGAALSSHGLSREVPCATPVYVAMLPICSQLAFC